MAIGALFSGLFGNKAAGAQSSAANKAAGLQFQLGEDALKQNQSQFDVTQANIAPWLKAGSSSIGTLADLLKNPGQGLLTPWTQQFQAPTADQARNTPGYQFLAGAGSGAIQNSAAAGGNLLSTGTLKTLSQFNQGLADTTYSETYNRAFNEYLQQYNQFQSNQSNEFNRLAAVSGIGQQAATTEGQLSQQASNTNAGISSTIGQQVGGNINLGGAARASGYASIANALTGGLNNINAYALLSMLGGSSGGSGSGGGLGVPA